MPSRPNVHRPNVHQAKASGRRGTAHQRGYTSAWQRASRAFLAAHPLCECDDCRKNGLVRAAEVVDHFIPHRGDMTLFWDESNWRAMTKRCHDKKTARGQ